MINFNLLNAKQTGAKVIANLPSSGGGGDSGMGGLLEGLQGLVGGIKGLTRGSTENVSPSVSNGVSQAFGDAGVGGINPAYANQSSWTGESRLGQLVNQNTNLQAPGMFNTDLNKNIFTSASKYQGLREGDQTLGSYLQKANPGLDPSVTPWCAGFVGSVLNANGIKGTGSLAAKSYLNYGQDTKQPSRGDIAVFNDMSGRNDPNHGHVGFVDSIDTQRGMVRVLGGNQGDTVSIKEYPLSSVAGFRVAPSGQQVQGFAQQNGIQSPDQLASLTKQAPQPLNNLNPDDIQKPTYIPVGPLNRSRPQALPNYGLKNAHPELEATMAGIDGVESAGSKNPYGLISKASKNGDRAYGKHQIMGANIPSWSTEVLGHPLTPQQFLASPEAQDKIAAYKINQYLAQGHSPQDAASLWFTGRSLKQLGGKDPRDAYGTSNSAYQKKFNKGYLGYRANNNTPDGGTTNNQGNIDLNNRPKVQNSDGTYSTVRTITVEIDGKTILLPTIINGKQVSNQEAVNYYKQTGENLGVFNSEKEANQYDKKMHEQQGWTGPKNTWTSSSNPKMIMSKGMMAPSGSAPALPTTLAKQQNTQGLVGMPGGTQEGINWGALSDLFQSNNQQT